MRRKKRRLSLFILLFLFVHNLFPSDLKLLKKITPKKFENFTNFSIFKENIYVTTYDSILKYDFNGQFIQKIGQKGEGPGDFKFLSDLEITDEELIAADRIGRKIVIFDKNGKLKNEIKTEYRIQELVIIEDNIFYLASISQKREKEERVDYFLKLINLKDGREILSLDDKSKIFAINPSGKMLPFPWFPAPFYNRQILLKGMDGKFRIFFTRDNYFYFYEDRKFKKNKYEFDFDVVPIKNEDKEIFFDYIEGVNRIKYPNHTKKSVVFPKSKEFFLGAMTWGNNFALIKENALIIISEEGRLIEEITFPREIEVESRWEFLYPERRLHFHNSLLYYYDENKGFLNIFEIK